MKRKKDGTPAAPNGDYRNVSIPAVLHKRIAHVAVDTDLSISELVTSLVEELCNRFEGGKTAMQETIKCPDCYGMVSQALCGTCDGNGQVAMVVTVQKPLEDRIGESIAGLIGIVGQVNDQLFRQLEKAREAERDELFDSVVCRSQLESAYKLGLSKLQALDNALQCVRRLAGEL